MRFRGKLVDIGCIQHFTRVVATISKLAKNCILRITKQKIYFILTERIVNGGVSIWCELNQDHFFNEYAMDGLSAEKDEIYLEVNPDSMLRCLKTASNAKSVKIKLTKKVTPALTFDVELPSLTTTSRLVVHDVPVHVIPARQWSEFQEPEVPDFDVSIYLPALKIVRNVVDKMKNLSNHVTLSANQSGEMRLRIEADLATVSTHFRDLEHPVWTSEEGEWPRGNVDKKHFFDVRIDIRKFAQLLTGQQVNPLKTICNIVNERIVHFSLLHEDVSLQYFIPAVVS